MLVKVQDFGAAYGDRFPETTLAKPLFAAVADAVTTLQAHDVSRQATSYGGGLSERDAAREALIDQLGAIIITARAVGLDTPGLDDKFQLDKKPQAQALLTTARLFARDAEAFTSAFVAHGMSNTFLADLKERIDQYDRALRDHDAGKDEHAAASASIEAALAAGTTAVRKLNAIVINRLSDDPAAMATWNRDRRVRYPRSRKAAAVAPAVVPESRPDTAAATTAVETAAPTNATPQVASTDGKAA